MWLVWQHMSTALTDMAVTYCWEGFLQTGQDVRSSGKVIGEFYIQMPITNLRSTLYWCLALSFVSGIRYVSKANEDMTPSGLTLRGSSVTILYDISSYDTAHELLIASSNVCTHSYTNRRKPQSCRRMTGTNWSIWPTLPLDQELKAALWLVVKWVRRMVRVWYGLEYKHCT